MSLGLTFHGAVATVTGSRHLLEFGERRLLIDCGLFQGLKELRRLNWDPLAFDPAAVGHVILTHCHIDHIGYLPRLVREGFRGRVYCTPPTRELSELMLLDAAHLQVEDADYANRQGFSKHTPALPLFDEKDVRRALALMRPVALGRWQSLAAGVRFRYHNAGHLLGAAFVEVRVPADGGRELSIVFSGDVGRYGVPLHSDPDARPVSDALVIESTYGDRAHDHTPLVDQLREAFLRTHGQDGTILIPAFAVGRAQLVTLLLRELMDKGELPETPIHIDSPMAAEATRIYTRHLGDDSLDDGLGDGHGRLFPRKIKLHRTREESKHLNDLPGPRVIIAGSGMLTGGRILHHLVRRLPREEDLILLSGYQAAGTRGRALLEGASTLRMHGQDIPVRASVLALHGLSGHADADELQRWWETARPARTVFVVHGEPPAAEALAARLGAEHTVVPRLGQRNDLGWLFTPSGPPA